MIEASTGVPMVISIVIPKKLWKTDNGSHGSWRAHALLMRQLKTLGYVHARNFRALHDGVSFERCTLDVFVSYPPRGKANADPSNADNVGKPIIDGFTKAGLWPDDSWEHVEGPFYRMDDAVAKPYEHVLRFCISGVPAFGAPVQK